MIDHPLLAAIALASGLVCGEIAGRITRNVLNASDRDITSRRGARTAGFSVFAFFALSGLAVAIAVASPAAVDAVAETSRGAAPDILAAVVVLLAFAVAATVLPYVIGQSVEVATGVRHPAVERTLRWGLAAVGMAMALAQAGVSPLLVGVLLTAVVGGPAAAAAALTASGGRDVARHIAAGRVLSPQLRPGVWIETAKGRGIVLAVHPATVEIQTEAGTSYHLPLASLLDDGFALATHSDRPINTRVHSDD